MRAAGSEKYDPVPGLLRVRPAAPERRSKYDLWSWVRSHTTGSTGTQARAFMTPSGCHPSAGGCALWCWVPSSGTQVPQLTCAPVQHSLAWAAMAALCMLAVMTQRAVLPNTSNAVHSVISSLSLI